MTKSSTLTLRPRNLYTCPQQGHETNQLGKAGIRVRTRGLESGQSDDRDSESDLTSRERKPCGEKPTCGKSSTIRCAGSSWFSAPDQAWRCPLMIPRGHT